MCSHQARHSTSPQCFAKPHPIFGPNPNFTRRPFSDPQRELGAMRLLASDSDGKLILTKDLFGNQTQIPPYAILSHTWHDQEVTFEDVQHDSETVRRKSGYRKIEFCIRQARRENLNHVWVDTCCIRKADTVELQTALNSMFRWYRDAEVCYVYLADVSKNDGDPEWVWEHSFRKSRWFTRGWTLQELLAPHKLLFFSHEGRYLGDRQTLAPQVHEITGIPLPALRGTTPVSGFSVDDRLSWIRGRNTKYEEDKAYSLLGLFDVFMNLIYGEGEEEALDRLRRKIDKRQKRLGKPTSGSEQQATQGL
jgi:hypothetical protein